MKLAQFSHCWPKNAILKIRRLAPQQYGGQIGSKTNTRFTATGRTTTNEGIGASYAKGGNKQVSVRLVCKSPGMSSKANTGNYYVINKDKTFQGQRFDDELGLDLYSFKWRNHDPQIGRFIQIDPLSNKYVYNSTYAFSENKVTSHVELEGLESVESNDPRVRALLSANVQKKLESYANNARQAVEVKVSVGLGVGVKAKIGNVQAEAGVGGPQAEVTVNSGGEVKAKGSVASAGAKVGGAVGEAGVSVNAGTVEFKDGKVVFNTYNFGDREEASKTEKSGSSSEKLGANSSGDISVGAKIGVIGVAVKANLQKAGAAVINFFGALGSYMTEAIKQGTQMKPPQQN